MLGRFAGARGPEAKRGGGSVQTSLATLGAFPSPILFLLAKAHPGDFPPTNIEFDIALLRFGSYSHV